MFSVIGRKIYQEDNILDNPPELPGLSWGTLSVSEQFEGHPTAEILMQGVYEKDLATIMAAYSIDAEFTISGMPFIVVARNATRYRLPIEFQEQYGTEDFFQINIRLDGKWQLPVTRDIQLQKIYVDTTSNRAQPTLTPYDVARAANIPYLGPLQKLVTERNPSAEATIDLESILTEAARLNNSYLVYSDPRGVVVKPFAEGRRWNLLPEQVIDEGEGATEFPPSFQGKKLTWGQGLPVEDPQAEQPYLDTPVIRTLEEGDPLAFVPPFDTQVIKDLSSNFDESGPTKTKRTVTQINGVTVEDETTVYGFAYLSRQVVNRTLGKIYNDQPQQFWQVVEYKKVTYTYSSVRVPASLPASFEDDSVIPAQRIPVFIDPEHPAMRFGQIQLQGGNIIISPSVRYLTEVATEGWQLARYQKETNNLESFDWLINPPTDPVDRKTRDSYEFFKNPLKGYQQYQLEPERAYYKVEPPIQVDLVAYDSLSLRLRNSISAGYISANGNVAIGTPQFNYVEPMLIMKETSAERSYSAIPDPEKEPTEDTPQPLLTVGKESFYETVREILVPSNRNQEVPTEAEKFRARNREFVAQDQNFKNSTELETIQDTAGRPPQASTISIRFSTQDAIKVYSEADLYDYVLTSDLLSNRSELNGTISWPNATSLQQAIQATQCELNIQHLQSQLIKKRFSWYLPEIRCGDFVILDGVEYRVMRVSHGFSYSGGAKYHDRISLSAKEFCTCDGCEMDLAETANRYVYGTLRPKFASIPASSGLGGVTQSSTFQLRDFNSVVSEFPGRRK